MATLEEQREKRIRRVVERYSFAKSVGFRGVDAAVCQSWSRKHIIREALSRGYKVSLELLTEIAGKGDTNAL